MMSLPLSLEMPGVYYPGLVNKQSIFCQPHRSLRLVFELTLQGCNRVDNLQPDTLTRYLRELA